VHVEVLGVRTDIRDKTYGFLFLSYFPKVVLARPEPTVNYRAQMSQLLWPSTESNYSFEAAVDDAILKKAPLFLVTNVVVNLTERILLKTNGTTLRIVGDSDCDSDSRPLIISSAHSLFQVGGRGSKLVLENLRLRHVCFREENKDIGAALFCLHKSKIEATNCEILSDYGFGIWAVQRASVTLISCRVSSTSRSGCVSFGRSNLHMESCTIHDCSIHGVCSRGTTILTLKSCEIMRSGIRGLYAYHNVTLTLEDTIITKTKSCDHAAIDLWGCSLENSCRDNSNTAESDTGDIFSGELHNSDSDAKSNIPDKELSNMGGSSSNGVEVAPDCSSLNQHYDPNSFSYKFPCPIRSEDNLNVSIIRCTILDNSGLGLRIRQGCSSGRGSRIDGVISNCCLHDNAVGNVLQIVGVLCYDMMVPDGSPAAKLYQPNTIPTAYPVLRNSLLSETVSPPVCPSSASGTHIAWEFERDDPSSNASQSAPQSSCSSSWHPYESSVSDHVQSKHAEFKIRISKAMADSCCQLQKSADLDPRVVSDNDDNDDDDSDCGSECLEEKSTRPLRDSEIRLPEPFSKYTIDFLSMQQTNTETHYTRSVRFREVKF
jgi:Right handed beta helix region/WWE domain